MFSRQERREIKLARDEINAAIWFLFDEFPSSSDRGDLISRLELAKQALDVFLKGVLCNGPKRKSRRDVGRVS